MAFVFPTFLAMAKHLPADGKWEVPWFDLLVHISLSQPMSFLSVTLLIFFPSQWEAVGEKLCEA